VPPIECKVTQESLKGDKKRNFPDVGFFITHVGDAFPVKVRIKAEAVLHDRTVVFDKGGYYSGEKLWNMNPHHFIWGHFAFPREIITEKDRIELRITVSIIDQYKFEHFLLPIGWVYVHEKNDWYAEP